MFCLLLFPLLHSIPLRLFLFYPIYTVHSAIGSMPLIVLTPLVQLTGFIIFMIPLLLYGFNIASKGDFVPVTM